MDSSRECCIDVSKCKDETEINDAIAGYVEKQKYPMAMKMSDGNYRGILYRFESINEDTAIKVGFIAYSVFIYRLKSV